MTLIFKVKCELVWEGKGGGGGGGAEREGGQGWTQVLSKILQYLASVSIKETLILIITSCYWEKCKSHCKNITPL